MEPEAKANNNKGRSRKKRLRGGGKLWKIRKYNLLNNLLHFLFAVLCVLWVGRVARKVRGLTLHKTKTINRPRAEFNNGKKFREAWND